MRKWILLYLLALMVSAKGQEAQKLTWSDLIVHVNFDDPFKKLDSEQLYNLSQVAKIRAKEEQAESELNNYDKAKKDSLEKWLLTENINIDSLLAIRYQIAELRKQQQEAVNTSLNNTKVTIGGYLLPLNFVDNKVSEFLLVPWVGACIHTPPPPKNQLIYFKSKEGIELHSRFQAVRVEGVITTNNKTSTLFLVDGSDEINSGYSIMHAKIKELQ